MVTDTRLNHSLSSQDWLLATAVQDCLVTGLIVINSHGEATLTPETVQMLQLKPGRRSRRASDILPPALVALAREAFKSKAPISSRLLDLPLAAGTELNLQVSAVPLVAGDPNSGALLVLHNLEKAGQIEKRLLQVDRLANIGTLAASLAHEIKNALVACRTFLDLLLEKKQEPELVDIVRREMARVEEIVSRMLEHSAPAAARISGPISIHEILENSLRLLRPQLKSRAIQVECAFDPGSDLAYGDEHELQQAFMNLLLNALEAGAPNGTLTIQTSRTPGGEGGAAELCVAIGDDGVGIPPENLEHLFEPFFTTKPNGTGLGLAITQRIIGEHQGRITVESKVSKGTTFRVFLPV